MRLLLDTMVIIHLVQAPTAVPVSTRAVLENPANDLFISLVSPWEMQIKADLGKLALGKPVALTIAAEISRGGIALLPIALAHIDGLSRLPPIHRDPFDRLLIAQAIAEEMKIVSGDQRIRQYPVQCLWD